MTRGLCPSTPAAQTVEASASQLAAALRQVRWYTADSIYFALVGADSISALWRNWREGAETLPYNVATMLLEECRGRRLDVPFVAYCNALIARL